MLTTNCLGHWFFQINSVLNWFFLLCAAAQQSVHAKWLSPGEVHCWTFTVSAGKVFEAALWSLLFYFQRAARLRKEIFVLMWLAVYLTMHICTRVMCSAESDVAEISSIYEDLFSFLAFCTNNILIISVEFIVILVVLS